MRDDSLTTGQPPETAPTRPVTRGICPSLAAPMVTGDGLLVRLRAESGSYSPAEIVALAAAARAHGNGLVDVTARGNLQIRGLRPGTVAALTADVLAAGIRPASGIAIECPPLAGLDPAAVCDPRALAGRLRRAIAEETAGWTLAAKLSLTVEAGETIGLGAIAADLKIRILAPERNALALGGTAETARPLGIFDDDGLIAAVLAVLAAASARGPRCRGRDLDGSALALPPALEGRVPPQPAPLSPVGLFATRAGPALGLRLPYGQIEATALSALVQAAAPTEIRLAPDHAVLLVGVDPAAVPGLRQQARTLGFTTRADDPAHSIALCAGARGCAAAGFDTHDAARAALAAMPGLFDGSLTLHLSGCSKGCAHPAPAALTFAGAPLGYALVVNGCASDSPQAYIAASDIEPAWQTLERLLREEKGEGETARACLDRLGPQRIAQVLQQGL